MRIFQKGFNFSQDGPGNRLVYHLQGCNLHCPWCSNPEGLSVRGGEEYTVNALVEEVLRSRMMFFEGGGVTLTGGEPMMQPEACLEIARAAHAAGKNVWCYTGFTFEALLGENNPARMALLREVDVLVDGPFVLAEKSLEVRFRGSRNQRLIDVKQSLAQGSAVCCVL